MKVSIAVLTVVTVLSISLLFIGDFEGRFERVFSTLSLFTVFVLLTMFDTRKGRKNDWYAPVALIANTYILGLLLIVIWVTPYEPFGLLLFISWQSIYVIVVTRLVVWGVELLLRTAVGKESSLQLWSQITAILGLLTLVMFTAPLGIQAFRIEVPELYWKFAVATLILTGLGVAVTLLLGWFFRAPKPTPPAVPVAPPAPQAQPQQPQQAPVPTPTPQAATPTTPQSAPQPVAPEQAPQPVVPQQPATSQPAAPQQPDAPAVPPASSGTQQPNTQPHSEQQSPELLPWPTFPDGSPLPMRADGQPDFSALEQPRQ